MSLIFGIALFRAVTAAFAVALRRLAGGQDQSPLLLVLVSLLHNPTAYVPRYSRLQANRMRWDLDNLSLSAGSQRVQKLSARYYVCAGIGDGVDDECSSTIRRATSGCCLTKLLGVLSLLSASCSQLTWFRSWSEDKNKPVASCTRLPSSSAANGHDAPPLNSQFTTVNDSSICHFLPCSSRKGGSCRLVYQQ